MDRMAAKEDWNLEWAPKWTGVRRPQQLVQHVQREENGVYAAALKMEENHSDGGQSESEI